MEIISSTNNIKIGLITFLICSIIRLLAIIVCLIGDKRGNALLIGVSIIVITISLAIGLAGLICMSQGKTYRVKVNDEITVGELKDAYRIEDYDAINDVWIVKEKK